MLTLQEAVKTKIQADALLVELTEFRDTMDKLERAALTIIRVAPTANATLQVLEQKAEQLVEQIVKQIEQAAKE